MKRHAALALCIAIGFVTLLVTPASATITSPTDIGGAVLWLDANDPATLVTDGGGLVSSWADKSSQGNDVTQRTGAPQLVQNVLGAGTKPVLRFDGGDALTRAGTSGLPAGNAARSMFFVANDGGNPNTGYVAGYGGTSTNLAFTYDFNRDAGTRVVGWGNDYETGLVASGQHQIWGVQYDGTTVRTFRDNDEGISSARNYATQSQNIRIGEWVNGGINFVGDLAEVIIYDSNLTDTQRGDVIGYLEDKYFPPIPPVDPVPGPGVTGNVLWLDGSDVDGDLQADTLTDGSLLGTWVDKSPSGGGDVGQTNTGLQPRVQRGAVGGRPAVRFDGGDWFAGSPVLAAGDDDYTYIAVWEPDRTNAVESVFEQADAGGALAKRSSILAVFGKYGFNGQNNDRHDLVSYGADQLRVTMMTVDNGRVENVHVADNGRLYAGRTDGTGGGPNELNIGAGSTRVAAKVANNGENLDGDIAEILVYDHVLTSAELIQVNQYIDLKYGLGAPAVVPAPLHKWTFEDENNPTNDSIGSAHGTLNNGAQIVDGKLVLDGVNDFMSTAVLAGPAGEPETITTKTLVAWVGLDNLAQQAGGVLTIENPTDLDVFDSIVFGEAAARKWMAGSNSFLRTQNPQAFGALEYVTDPDSVMIAIVYGADNSVTIYRDGMIYGQYTKGTLQTYSTANSSDVLLGLRHGDRSADVGTVDGADVFLAGSIDEARIYGVALTQSQIQALVPEPGTFALLALGLVGVVAMRLRKR